MISLIIQQAFAGLWAEVWRFGLGFGIMILLFAAAYISPIGKKWFLRVGVAVGIFMIAFTTGVVVGEKRVRAQWAVAEERALQTAEDARASAERSVARKSSRGVRTQPAGPDCRDCEGAVRSVAPHHLFQK